MMYEIQEKICLEPGEEIWSMIAMSDLRVEADRIVRLLNMWRGAEGHEYRVWVNK